MITTKNSYNKNSTAFTLAEVMIVIAIIGIIVAMTLPTLLTNYNKEQTVVKLKHAISILNQAYMMSFADNGEPDIQRAYNMGDEKYFKTYWAPYIKTAKVCKTYKECGYLNFYPWKNIKSQAIAIAAVESGNSTTFYTSDGFLYVIKVRSYDRIEHVTDPSRNIIVDINGAKGPNIIGKDVFNLIRINGRIEPLGYDKSNSIINQCRLDGQYCAEKIRRNGWVIAKDYPW